MSFAERVRQSQRTFAYPSDKESSVVQLETSEPPRHSIIRFNSEKPAEADKLLADAGFSEQENGDYMRPINFETRIQDRLIAERAYADLRRLTKESPDRVNGRG